MSRNPYPRSAKKKQNPRARIAPAPPNHLQTYDYVYTTKDGDKIEFRAPGGDAAKAFCAKRHLSGGTLSGGPERSASKAEPKAEGKASKKRSKK